MKRNTRFVIVTKNEFENNLSKSWDWEVIDVPNCKEYVYDLWTKNASVNIRIYSTVDMRTNQTREIGTDAIRIVYWDNKNSKPIGKGKKILRTEGKTTIHERIYNRIQEFMDGVGKVEVIDMEYTLAVLTTFTSMKNNNFGNNLLEWLEDKGSLSDKQLAYVLGEKSPKGFPTFEAQVKKSNPDFWKQWQGEENGGDSDDSEQQHIETGFDSSENRVSESKVSEEELQSTLEKRSKNKKDGKSALAIAEKLKKLPSNKSSDKLIPTKEYKYHSYNFDTFNPVQSEVMQHVTKDINMVIGANTSAGKTICAEFFMDDTLANGDKIIYLSPLKSLTQEKFDDWSKRYSDKKITILTGDYSLSDKMKKNLRESEIVVLTSEMLDSRTRKMKQEKNQWLKEVGLVIVDESHIITTNRGHAVESGIMRFTNINKDARVIFLSATMPNVNELGEWLTVLNGKQTEVISSTWRPVELEVNCIAHPMYHYGNGRFDYWATQEKKMEMAVELAMDKPDEKYLVFVHDKGTGRKLVRMFQDKGEKAIFHNADLNLSDRLDIETSFRDRENGLRVMISTSSTAWGVNLPARNVIVVGVTRGMQEVDSLDIIQMMGRAGRYGINDAGFVYFLIPETELERWKYEINNPREVISCLLDKVTLCFHVLAEINNREIVDSGSLMRWYKRSLAAKQESKMKFTREDAVDILQTLNEIEMITDVKVPAITGLGRVSALMYFSPFDIYGWFKNFSTVVEHKEITDEALAICLGNVASNDVGYIPKDIDYICSDFIYGSIAPQALKSIIAINTAASIVGYHLLITGETTPSPRFGSICRNLVFDIQRASQAIFMINKFHAHWDREYPEITEIIDTLTSRVRYGVSKEMIPLTKLAGIGGARAKKMWEGGIKSLESIADGSKRSELIALFNPKTYRRLKAQALELVKN